MSSEGSITHWISGIKGGDEVAAQKLWERYFERLVQLARKKLVVRNASRRVVDEEDIALSAFKSFWRGAVEGRFPALYDRDNLWRLLVVITARKAVDQIQSEHALKRGGGKLLGESALQGHQSSGDVTGIEAVVGDEPTPEFAAQVAEECRGILESLGNDTLRRVAIWKMEGYTNDEIAGKLGSSRRTVARKLAIIRKQLEAKP